MKKLLQYLEVLAALIGASGILYAFGFLAVRAHLRMLGATDIPIRNQQYLESGGYFIWKTILSALVSFRTYLGPFILFILTAVLLRSVVPKFVERSRHSWPKIFGFVKTYVVRAACSTILAVNIVAAIGSLSDFTAPLTLSGLLFDRQGEFIVISRAPDIPPANTADAGGSQLTPANQARRYLIAGDDVALAGWYAKLSAVMIFYIALAFAFRTVSTTNPESHSILARVVQGSIYATIALHFLLLPLDYGVLLMSTTYSKARVYTKGANHTEKYFLLGQDDSNLALFNSTKREVLLLRQSTVDRIIIHGEGSIFTKSVQVTK